MARQQVRPGSRAPGRRLSVDTVTGSTGHMNEGLGGSHCSWGGTQLPPDIFSASIPWELAVTKGTTLQKVRGKADSLMMVSSLAQTRRPVLF